ncbi:MAG: hypothetical protein RMN51_04600 [Verrucomicrobiota bacterium]|nr:hypothetical protein [Limisphaera sp.]MDW8381372.1 hypothetical protein [Verrucomicrobiota bacterium]
MKWTRQSTQPLRPLPAGSFTVDRQGHVLASTLPSDYPTNLLREVAQHVLATFREAREAGLTLTDLVVRYEGLKLTARELRGGALIFLFPQVPFGNMS